MRRSFWSDFQFTPAAIFAAWPLELFLIFEAVTHPWLGWLLISILIGGAAAVFWDRHLTRRSAPSTVDDGLTSFDPPSGMYPCPECGVHWPSDRAPAAGWRCPACWQRTPMENRR